MTDTARVRLWGKDIGAVTWVPDRGIGVFQYTPEFVASGIQPSPLMMPLREAPYEFPTLRGESFNGLPGMLSDSLPDKFGNALINAWLATQARDRQSFNPVERLCYTGSRGMGALEFLPAISGAPSESKQVQVDALVKLANRVLDERVSLQGKFANEQDTSAIENILRVGTSAGGARAKAVVAWNEETRVFRSGQAPVDEGFTSWLIKFDGVDGNRDKELADPAGFGRIEYAYYLMARAAGIDMQECRIYEEGGRAHFMTQRFDRTASGRKRHLQSLAAIRHFDFNQAGAYSYEQAIETIKRLGLPMSDSEQQLRRACFNILARNQDDHVKNIAFLMNRRGQWRLSPAYDVTYSYNPSGDWTSQHQMSLNGKRDEFQAEDIFALATTAGIKKARAKAVLNDVLDALHQWATFAGRAGVADDEMDRISHTFRINIFKPNTNR